MSDEMNRIGLDYVIFTHRGEWKKKKPENIDSLRDPQRSLDRNGGGDRDGGRGFVLLLLGIRLTFCFGFCFCEYDRRREIFGCSDLKRRERVETCC